MRIRSSDWRGVWVRPIVAHVLLLNRAVPTIIALFSVGNAVFSGGESNDECTAEVECVDFCGIQIKTESVGHWFCVCKRAENLVN
jgi:hypothetical protein